MIKAEEMYGQARDLNEALLGRQPKVLLLLPLFLYFIFFSLILHDVFPF